MKKIKRLHLLQKKENLKQRTTISHLANIKSESEKCQKVEKELKDLADQKLSESDEVNGYSFHANRQLIQKLMEQREILINRQEFLKNEELVVAKEINQSKANSDVKQAFRRGHGFGCKRLSGERSDPRVRRLPVQVGCVRRRRSGE